MFGRPTESTQQSPFEKDGQCGVDEVVSWLAAAGVNKQQALQDIRRILTPSPQQSRMRPSAATTGPKEAGEGSTHYMARHAVRHEGGIQ